MTSDQWIALGTIAALVAAVAGIVAAVFAIRADLFGRASRKRDLQPGPRARWPELGLAFYNVGAAAHHLAWLGVYRGRLFAAFASLPPEFGDYMAIGPADLGDLPGRAADRLKGAGETVIMVARDVEGRWWDCRKGQRLPDQPIAGQLMQMLAAVGLDGSAGPIFTAWRLEK